MEYCLCGAPLDFSPDGVHCLACSERPSMEEQKVFESEERDRIHSVVSGDVLEYILALEAIATATIAYRATSSPAAPYWNGSQSHINDEELARMLDRVDWMNHPSHDGEAEADDAAWACEADDGSYGTAKWS